MADRVTIIPPRDPWPLSTVTADDLEDLVAEGLLRPLSDERQPEWIPPPERSRPVPATGVRRELSFHERGFGVPESRFMRAILHNYGVELHNLCHTRILGVQNPGANIITRCAGTKSHTYDDSWHRIECHNFTI
jgi:hypothetical protein